MKGATFADPHARCAHRRYRMTCAEYDELRGTQEARCAVCSSTGHPLMVDHDHAVGQWAVRGLVCRLCNSVLRDVDYGRRAADERVSAYLSGAWHLGRAPRHAPVADVARSRPLTADVVAWAQTKGRTVKEDDK